MSAGKICWLFGTLVFIGGIMWGTFYWIPRAFPAHMEDGTENRGKISSPAEFGEMFNGAGALFTGLALAGIVITLLMQRDQSIAQEESSKQLTGDQLRIAGLLEGLETRLADTGVAVKLLSVELASQGRRMMLAARIAASESERDRIIERASKIRQWSPGSPEERLHLDLVKQKEALDLRIKTWTDELEEQRSDRPTTDIRSSG